MDPLKINIRKSEHYVDLGPISMGYEGSKLKVQGTDSYPVNECILYMYVMAYFPYHLQAYTYREK